MDISADQLPHRFPARASSQTLTCSLPAGTDHRALAAIACPELRRAAPLGSSAFDGLLDLRACMMASRPMVQEMHAVADQAAGSEAPDGPRDTGRLFWDRDTLWPRDADCRTDGVVIYALLRVFF
jgi:hypothetical protein